MATCVFCVVFFPLTRLFLSLSATESELRDTIANMKILNSLGYFLNDANQVVHAVLFTTPACISSEIYCVFFVFMSGNRGVIASNYSTFDTSVSI